MSRSEPLLVVDSTECQAAPVVPSKSSPVRLALLISLAVVLSIVVVIALSVDFVLIQPDRSNTPTPSPSPAHPFHALPPCGREDCGADCKIPPLANFSQLPTIPRFPDPFLSLDGSRITTQQQWTCRRAETSAQLQRYELGVKPTAPSVLGFITPTCATCLNGTITVSVGDDPFISFNASYQLPTVGQAPYPAMIGIGGISLTVQPIRDLGVATITFNNNDIAAQNGPASRGVGKFYTLYGSQHSAGALMAWAWGVSRLIDALEMEGRKLFDTRRLGVTGCSRNGKGALVVGAFDERIALTIPQESGSGGAASWRLSDWQGTQVQTLGEIIYENVWLSTNFNQFNGYTTRLPVDHHQLEGLVAPRGLLVVENSDMVWLGNITCWGNSLVANSVYQALGVPQNQGVSQVGGHNHCAQPASQQPEITAFINRFLLGKDVNTSILYTDRNYPSFSVKDWAPWTVPILT